MIKKNINIERDTLKIKFMKIKEVKINWIIMKEKKIIDSMIRVE